MIKKMLEAVLIASYIIAIVFVIITCVSLMTTRVTITEYNDECLFEVEGNEDRQFPYYELHPMEDCEE